MTADPARAGGGRPIWARVALFFVVIVMLVWFTNIEPGRRCVAGPVTRISVLAARVVINAFGGEARADGTFLSGPTAMLDIKDGCNGVIAMILYVAAVLAHGAAPAAKIAGLAIGIPAIWAINLLRIVTLYAVAVVAPGRLEFFHIYFWQTLIIIFVAILWYLWADRTLRGESRDVARGSGRPEGGSGAS
jgi:exosortase/archaeosortase family protein